MATLFETDATPVAAPVVHVDWFAATAIRCHGKPDGWETRGWNSGDAPEGFVKVVGAKPTFFYVRGPKKGKPNWDAQGGEGYSTVWIKFDEIEETKRLYSESTGNCIKCCGTGQEWAGWSAKEGSRYRPCRECDATGTAKTQPASTGG